MSSELKPEQFQNILPIVVTLEVSKFSPKVIFSSFGHVWNIEAIFVTFAVLKLLTSSSFTLWQLLNMACKLVAFSNVHFSPKIISVSRVLHSNIEVAVFTWVVSKLLKSNVVRF